MTPTIDMAALSRRAAAFRFRARRSRSKRRCAGPSSAWNTASCKCRIRAISDCSIPAPVSPRNARIASPRLFNPQLASSASSPVPVALESHVIRAVARRAGFGDAATGHFATGGSEANYTALICALTGAHSEIFRRRRARLRRTGEVLYVARLPHRVAENRASGRRRARALRLVDTDGRGRMDAAGAAARHCRMTAPRARFR